MIPGLPGWVRDRMRDADGAIELSTSAARVGEDVRVEFEPGLNVLTGETAALAGSLFAALSEALPVVRATPGPETLLVAGRSAEAVTLDPTILARRWERRGIHAHSFAAALLPVLLPPDRVEEQEAALRDASQTAAASRDEASQVNV